MITNLLYPKKCVNCGKKGQYFCQRCKDSLSPLKLQICPVCYKPAISGKTHPGCISPQSLNGLTSIFAYNGSARQAIKKLKFRFVTALINEFMTLTIKTTAKHHHLFSMLKKQHFHIVPIPLHPQRHRWRGFNQAQQISQHLFLHLKIPYIDSLIKRAKNTNSQSELKTVLSTNEKKRLRGQSSSEFDYQQKSKQKLTKKKLEHRFANVKGAFKLNKTLAKNLSPQNILLVDDVWTSGATMKESAKVLKRNGFNQVWGFTITR